MTRRGFLLSGACLLATTGSSLAMSYDDDVAARLRREGYRITYRKRTWLGRVRFKARKGKTIREIVVDPTSGEVLRDYSESVSADDKRSPESGSSGGGTSGGETGGGETGGASGGGETGGGESGGGETGGGESGGGETGGESESGDNSKETGKGSGKGKSKDKSGKGNADSKTGGSGVE